jgi:hypothetical protein
MPSITLPERLSNMMALETTTNSMANSLLKKMTTMKMTTMKTTMMTKTMTMMR